MALGRIAEAENDYKTAVQNYGTVLKNSDKKSESYLQSKKRLEEITKMFKNKKNKK